MRLGLPEPWYRDDHVTFFLGDAEEIVSGMPPGSVDCIVTSPPYWRLRDYAHPAQLGQETTPDAYVQRLRAVFAAAHRVLADHGTLWVNLGDRYATGLPCPATGPAPSGPPNAGRSVGAKNLLGLDRKSVV